jgi:hypothetical protein
MKLTEVEVTLALIDTIPEVGVSLSAELTRRSVAKPWRVMIAASVPGMMMATPGADYLSRGSDAVADRGLYHLARFPICWKRQKTLGWESQKP